VCGLQFKSLRSDRAVRQDDATFACRLASAAKLNIWRDERPTRGPSGDHPVPRSRLPRTRRRRPIHSADDTQARSTSRLASRTHRNRGYVCRKRPDLELPEPRTSEIFAVAQDGRTWIVETVCGHPAGLGISLLEDVVPAGNARRAHGIMHDVIAGVRLCRRPVPLFPVRRVGRVERPGVGIVV
jgi:hypothetical protein